jgi:hypothetical protein
MKRLLIILFFLVENVLAQSGMQVTGYFPTWWYGAVRASDFDMSSLTNLIIFPAQDASATSPYFTASNADDGTYFQELVSAAHTASTKVLISVAGGYGQTVLPVVAADFVKCSTFVATACAWAKARNLDGIEIDWEFPRASDSVGWNQLIKLFRQKLDTWNPKGLLMTSVNYTGPGSPPYYVDSMAVFDQILHMSYTMWMGATQESPYKSGFDTPVNQPAQFSGYSGTSLSNCGLLSWISAGYPSSKMSVGIPFESTIFHGVTTMGQSYSEWGFGSVATTSKGGGYPSVPVSGRHYDATAQAAWCVNGTTVYSYQDTNSVKAIVAWAKSHSYGGIMIYDFPAGQDGAATPEDDLLRVVARETFAGSTHVTGDGSVMPDEMFLSQNYPNPFNPSTTLDFSLPKRAHVRLTILNILGEHIVTLVNEDKDAGVHRIFWNASNYPSGTYFYRLQVGNYSETKKLVLLK